MALAGIVLRSCWLQYRGLVHWATPGGYVAYKLILPVCQILFFVQLGVFATGRANALYFAIGNALQLAALNGIFGVVQAVANERRYGTLSILLGSPANRLASFLSRALGQVLDGVVAVAVGLATTAILFGLDVRSAQLPLLLLCVVVIALSTSGLGLMLGSLGLVVRDALVIGNVIYYLLLVTCGINFPVASLPVWLRVISYSLPLTRGVQAAREVVLGAGLGQVAPLVAGELAVGAAYAVAGYALFRWLERRARRGGLQDAA